jgi:hypothetical protein
METTHYTLAMDTDSLVAACIPADRILLDRYCAHMLAEETPFRKRTLMLSTAAEFLIWWRTLYVGAEYEIEDRAGSRPNEESAWPHLRESFLRFACPDRDLRQEQRTYLNQFLRFVQAEPECLSDAPEQPVDAMLAGMTLHASPAQHA